GGALIALALSILIPERKRVRERAYVPAPARNAAHNLAGGPAKAAGAAVAILMLLCSSAFATAPGINAYQQGKFENAYKEFQETLKSHPQSRAEEKLQFDSAAAAYKLKDYNKALESFSQALLTPDTGLQTKGHYNLGNTLYQRGEMHKTDDNNHSRSSSKTRTSRIKRISSRPKSSSRKTNRAATRTKKNNSKKTSLRQKTNRKRNNSNSPAKVHLLRPAQKSSRTISLRLRRANDRLNNHQVPVKEKTKSRRRHREKARRKTPPLPPRNRRKRNLPAKSKAQEEITH